MTPSQLPGAEKATRPQEIDSSRANRANAHLHGPPSTKVLNYHRTSFAWILGFGIVIGSLGIVALLLYALVSSAISQPTSTVGTAVVGPSKASAKAAATKAAANMQQQPVTQSAARGTAVPGQGIAVGGTESELKIVANQPLRVQLPRLGLDVDVLAQSRPADGVFNPPTVGNAYWISDYGVAGPSSENTVYLVAHSSGDIDAAFNPLLDIRRHTGAVRKTDQITVGTSQGSFSYTVTGTAVYNQNSVATQADLWQQRPGRLVLITCFQVSGTLFSGQNYVIYAELNH